MERGFGLCKPNGFNSLVTMQSWMFLSSYEALRDKLLIERTIQTMAHLGARAFSEISGEVVQTTAFVIHAAHIEFFKPVFFRLLDGGSNEKESALLSGVGRFDQTIQADFKQMPGCPIAYWATPAMKRIFQSGSSVGLVGSTKQGLATGDNGQFLRYWHEVSLSNFCSSATSRDDARQSGKKWFPCNKGGAYRKWFGNNDYVVNWANDGEDIKFDKLERLEKGQILASNSKPKNMDYYFKEGITWSAIATGDLSMRYSSSSFMFETKGAMYFGKDHESLMYVMALSNSKISGLFLRILSPTLDFHEGPFLKLPLIVENPAKISETVDECISIAKRDWDAYETSWQFLKFGLASNIEGSVSISQSFDNWSLQIVDRLQRLHHLEVGILVAEGRSPDSSPK